MHLKPTLLFAFVAATLAAQTPAADPNKVVATVAGRDITIADVEKMVSSFNAQEMQTFQANPQFVLSQYFLFIGLAEEGEKAKLLEKSPYKEQFDQLKIQLLRNARVNEENNSYPVSTEMIDSYYKQHSAQWEQARIKVIQIAFAGQAVPAGTSAADAARQALTAAHAKRSEADARTLADNIVKQLRGGADFVKLVDQYSEDPVSKAAHGDFGVIKSLSDYPADLKTAVFALKAGEISDPIRQPTAFYIVRVEEKGTHPVDDLRETIVQAIRNEHMNQWMKDMNTSHQAVIKDQDYFKARGGPAAQPGGFSIVPPNK